MQAFLESIGAHPHAALVVVALLALAESLAVVGTIVPAAIVMFGAGARVGNGSLDLWETLIAATLGGEVHRSACARRTDTEAPPLVGP